MPVGVVADAGPLIALARLNLLHLLEKLYGDVAFPPFVFAEVVTEGRRRGYPDAIVAERFFKHHGWEPTSLTESHPSLASRRLDRGERDSISLALESNAMLLIDEERGRVVARELGLVVRGTLGVLAHAYRGGLIDADQLRLHFEQIEADPNLWISQRLCRDVLAQVLGTLDTRKPLGPGE